MIWIGIDPGLAGGIAMIDDEKDKVNQLKLFRMPIVKESDAHGKNHYVLYHAELLNILLDVSHINAIAFIEKQHPVSNQGRASIFSLAFQYGALVHSLVATGIKYEIITAKEWQKEFGIKKDEKSDTKQQAAIIATTLFPDAELIPARHRVLHSGIVDALLIAEYGRRKTIWSGGTP